MMTYQSDTIHFYLQMQITTASAARLVCIMHEQCSRLLRQAQRCVLEKRRSLLDKAQNVLVLLQRSLIISDPTSKSLFYLYDYCYTLLENSDDQQIASTLTIIDPLGQTFKKLLGSSGASKQSRLR